MVYSALSIIVPCRNQRYTIRGTLQNILGVAIPHGLRLEVIVVDDGSTDGTSAEIQQLHKNHPGIITLAHETTKGFGACIKTALARVTGDVCIVQDAALAYDPSEYHRLLDPIIDGLADVVIGSRTLPCQHRRLIPYHRARRLNKISRFVSRLANREITDILSPFCAYRALILKSIPIRCSGAEVSIELAMKAIKRGFRIYEAPVSFRGWSYEGDATMTLRQLWRGRFTALGFYLVDDIYENQYGHDILHRLSATHRFNQWMADTIRPWVGDKVLEIGAGMGNLSMKLLPRETYVVSDIDPLHLDYLRQVLASNMRVQVEVADLEKPEDFDALENTFDTVVCLNVVEHVNNDEMALQNIRRALVPGGRACILVPQIPAIYGTLDKVLGHFRRYTRAELTEKLTRAGFEVEHAFSFNRPAVPAWWLNGRIFRATNFGRIQLKMYDSLVWLFRIIDRMLPWPGVSIIAIARKPM